MSHFPIFSNVSGEFMARQDAIIFDLDGTLVDTAPDLTKALNHVLKSLGRDDVRENQVRHMVGLGGRKLLECGLAITGETPAASDIDALLARFLEYYSQNLSVFSTVFPGAIEILTELQDQGVKLGICTNKPIAFSHRLVHALGLGDFFPVILGSDSVKRRKPDPDHLWQTIDQLGASRARSVMVGDSENDVRTAKAARVPVVAVTFGYSHIAPEKLGADAIISDFHDLPAVLADL
ncbi:MAG: phosphoglycolate phosphatase [Sphingomonadales bacterium]